jgi:hypothetical protein
MPIVITKGDISFASLFLNIPIEVFGHISNTLSTYWDAWRCDVVAGR